MPSEQARIVALLDEQQAAERAGAEALSRWITSCREPALRGGLRLIAARDESHAALAELRLRALGATPTARASRALVTLCGTLSASDVSDRSKLAVLLARFPEQLYDPFAELVRQIATDDETRVLLETIGDDERASLRWLREMSESVPVESEEDGLEERDTVVETIDALHAAATAAAEVFSAWLGICGLASLRGGLRTAAAREEVHARVLAERLRELGTAPRLLLDQEVRAAAVDVYSSSQVSDARKIGFVLTRYPDPAAVVRVFGWPPEVIREDRETREMLRFVGAGEMDTVAWLRAYDGTAHSTAAAEVEEDSA